MRIASLAILCLLTVAPIHAQRPRSLGDVKTIRLANIPPTAMTKALVYQIQQSGVFEMVSNKSIPQTPGFSRLMGATRKPANSCRKNNGSQATVSVE